jgi:hypothetical protein
MIKEAMLKKKIIRGIIDCDKLGFRYNAPRQNYSHPTDVCPGDACKDVVLLSPWIAELMPFYLVKYMFIIYFHQRVVFYYATVVS